MFRLLMNSRRPSSIIIGVNTSGGRHPASSPARSDSRRAVERPPQPPPVRPQVRPLALQRQVEGVPAVVGVRQRHGQERHLLEHQAAHDRDDVVLGHVSRRKIRR